MINDFTHAGKMGDLFNCLPIFSAHYKQARQKCNIHLANFDFVQEAVSILKLQECIGEVNILDYVPDHYGCGGQPYNIDIGKECYNLGFRRFPDKPYALFVAEEYKLPIDFDFRLNLGDNFVVKPKDIVNIDNFNNDISRSLDLPGEYLDLSNSLLYNLRVASFAKEVNCWIGSFALLMHLFHKKINIYCPKGWLEDLHRDFVYTFNNNYKIIGV